LLEKPDLLKFQVVNPNNADGVPSQDKALSILGPEIADAEIQAIKDDTSQFLVLIKGANFRRGAVVEFFKVGMDDAPVIQKIPTTLTIDKVTVLISARKLEKMGNFRVRLVNPGTVSVAPAFFNPRHSELASSDY
jgi:hypothetical protein